MITGIVLTKNEEKNIKKCLESLSFCDEILIIDDYSNDKTIDISKKFHNVKIHERKLDDFSSQRNYGLKIANNEWVLFLDADEIVSNNLKVEIEKAVVDASSYGYFIKRNDFIFGKKLKYGDTGRIKLLRLGKKSGGEWVGKVHEMWKINGKTEILKNPIIHYPHQTLREFIHEIGLYSSMRADELYKDGKKSDLLDIIFYPKFKFLNLYVLKFGFLDGIEGFVHAMCMSLYSFLVRGKLYLKNK